MRVLKIYDPAMCCDSGVCGVESDPVLPRFAADLDWLRGEGIEVLRFNLAQEPGAFVTDPLIKAEIHGGGDACLPLVVLDNTVLSRGEYPGREQLGAWVGLAVAPVVAEGAASSEGCCSVSEPGCC